MGSGISFLAGLLTGAASGVEQGRKIKLAKEENEIRKQQVEATKALGFAQIAATGENQRASLALSRELGLLGIGVDRARIGLGYAGLGSENTRAQNQLATQVLITQMNNAASSGNIELEGKIRGILQDKAWGQGEISADRGVDRAIAQHKGISLINEEASARDLENEYDYWLRKMHVTGQDVAGQIAAEGRLDDRTKEAWTRELGAQMVGVMMRNQDVKNEQQSRYVEMAAGQMFTSIAAQEKDPILAAAKMKKFIAEMDSEDPVKSQRARAITKQLLDGLSTGYQPAIQDAITAVSSMYDAPSATGGGTGKAAPTSLTKKPETYKEWADANPAKASTTAKATDIIEQDVPSRIFNVPGVKDIAIRAYTNAHDNSKPPSDEALHEWVAGELNVRKDITGDPATRAIKAFQKYTWTKDTGISPTSGSRGAGAAPSKAGTGWSGAPNRAELETFGRGDRGRWEKIRCYGTYCTWRNLDTGAEENRPR